MRLSKRQLNNLLRYGEVRFGQSPEGKKWMDEFAKSNAKSRTAFGTGIGAWEIALKKLDQKFKIKSDFMSELEKVRKAYKMFMKIWQEVDYKIYDDAEEKE